MARRTSEEESRRLEDEHLFKLSERLTNVGNLEKLAYRGLTLEHHQVESALQNNPRDIQTAAHDILSAWCKEQENRVQAYTNLKIALQECHLDFLTRLLEKSDANSAVSSAPSRSLLDYDIQWLSERFTEEGVLKKLAYRGLKMESHDIQSAISNHPSDIQSAAHDVLRNWQYTQVNREEALGNLLAALEKSNLMSLAEELKQWMRTSKPLIPITEERIRDIKQWTKESLKERPFSTAKSKIWTETPGSIPLQEIYTKPRLVKKERKIGNIKFIELKDISEIFGDPQSDGPPRILTIGSGGCGKSTAMKQVSFSWANDEFTNIDFIFHISLGPVENDDDIESIIVQQHKGLKGNNVQPAEITEILENRRKNVIIILDGYDEYEPRTNSDIDHLITREYLRNCGIILASRETDHLPKIREYMNSEVEITGFDEQGVEEYAAKYLGSSKCDELLQKTEKGKTKNPSLNYGILHIPIFLNMICTLFLKDGFADILKGTSAILSEVVNRCPNWESIRKTGKERIHSATNAILRLGRLALKGLQRDGHQQIFTKEEIIEEVGHEAFELGLLTRIEPNPHEEEQKQRFSFNHLIFQEFTAGKFAAISQNELRKYFESWEAVMKNQEVIKYACALTGNQQGLLEFVYKLLSEYILKQTNISKHMFDSEVSFLKSLMKEASDSSSIDPLHNRYMNYIKQGDTKIFVPSKLYIFGPATYEHKKIDYIEGNLPTPPDMSQAECVMKLGSGDKGNDEHATEVLKIMQHIKKTTDQKISIAHLDWKYISLPNEFNIRQLAISTLKISQNLTSICMWTCKIHQSIYDHLVSQLQQCDNLKRLDLSECQSVNIGQAIAASKTLSDVYLYDSVLSPDAYRDVANELQKHKKIKQLHLNRTKGVPVEMANAVAEMKSLQVFRAKECAINKAAVAPLLKSLSNCRELQELRLGKNRLTDCATHLFPPRQSHPGWPLLKSLWINRTHLSKKDVEALSDTLRANKLPRLEHLDLSYNYEMADTLGELLNGTLHPGFPCLIYLDFMNINLTGKDLLSVAQAVEQGRLPKLRRLNLGRNNLLGREDQVRILVQSCISKYGKLDVIVQMFDTNLSETFVRELQSLCENSVVRVTAEMIRKKYE